MNIIAVTALLIAIFVAPNLKSEDAYRQWSALASGIVVVQIEDKWVLYSAKQVPCAEKDSTANVFFKSESETCYLVDSEPIGYYDENPTDPKNYKLPLHHTIEKTWKPKK